MPAAEALRVPAGFYGCGRWRPTPVPSRSLPGVSSVCGSVRAGAGHPLLAREIPPAFGASGLLAQLWCAAGSAWAGRGAPGFFRGPSALAAPRLQCCGRPVPVNCPRTCSCISQVSIPFPRIGMSLLMHIPCPFFITVATFGLISRILKTLIMRIFAVFCCFYEDANFQRSLYFRFHG